VNRRRIVLGHDAQEQTERRIEAGVMDTLEERAREVYDRAIGLDLSHWSSRLQS
jgi:hypothetical protein